MPPQAYKGDALAIDKKGESLRVLITRRSSTTCTRRPKVSTTTAHATGSYIKKQRSRSALGLQAFGQDGRTVGVPIESGRARVGWLQCKSTEAPGGSAFPKA